MVAIQEDLLPMEGSLLCKYKGMTKCNKQVVKLGKFGREIKWNFFFSEMIKNVQQILLLKIFKRRQAFFFPRRYPGVRMLVQETDYYIFRIKRIRIGVYLAFMYKCQLTPLSEGLMDTYCICADSITVTFIKYKMFILSTIYKVNSFFQSKHYCLQLSLTFR